MGSYWQLGAGWVERWTDGELPEAADFVIVGAGFAGLMTAIELRAQHPSATIVVLEAERVGHGASGRNAGFLSPLAAPVWLLGAERSPDQAWAAARLNAEVRGVARWIAEHVPDCELAPATLGLEADTRLSVAALRELARAIDHVGLEHELGESRVGSGRTVLVMDAYTLHPYKLVLGLARLVVQQGIVIRERARVHRIEALGAGGARVELAGDSSLRAGKVVVCTNAYTRSIDTGERVRALVVHSFMMASRPIDPARLVRAGDFTVEVNPAQAYHRLHQGRLIYGGIDRLRAPAGGDFAVPSRERAQLAAQLGASFPGVPIIIEQAWSGCFHATATGLPIIRMATDNHAIVFNVGYGGTGVALSLACARLAACVASHGRFTSEDDVRLLSVIHATRISVRDSSRTLGRMARRIAMPWLGR